jgi:hypothetical protein
MGEITLVAPSRLFIHKKKKPLIDPKVRRKTSILNPKARTKRIKKKYKMKRKHTKHNRNIPTKPATEEHSIIDIPGMTSADMRSFS